MGNLFGTPTPSLTLEERKEIATKRLKFLDNYGSIRRAEPKVPMRSHTPLRTTTDLEKKEEYIRDLQN